ncbi:sensor domain-containing protein [Effusibacillus lacus]|uniref:sensor domain-containing protein n=1 Tax=Effusibacillus lacus TaxID=1348429 RepID=UPI0014054AB8|nr:EAL domain-containing protein [Effusibacillus lacus]
MTTAVYLLGSLLLYFAVTGYLDKRKAERALQSSENRFLGLLHYANDMIFIYEVSPDYEPKLIEVNSRACEKLGYSRQELMALPSLKIFAPECVIPMDEVKQQLSSKGEATYEWIFFTKQNTRIPVETNLRYVVSNNQKMLLAISRDISDRKLTEKVLRESDEKYYTIIENLKDGYYEVDIYGNFTFANSSLCNMLGYKEDELIGLNHRNYTDEENAKKLLHAFNRVFVTGEPVKSMEFEYHTQKGKQGESRVAEISVSLIKDVYDQPVGFRGIVRDITDKKRAKLQLEESEQRYKSIVENNSDAIYSVDLYGKLLTVNPAAEKLTGYHAKELCNRNMIELVVPEDVEKAITHFNKAKAGDPQDYEVSVIHNEGQILQIHVKNVPIVVNNRIVGVYGIARDVTARNKAIETINHMAYHDILTDLPNRRFFQEQLRVGLQHAKAQGEKLAVVFLDLDRFKVINDTYGHGAGDRLLQIIADRLQDCRGDNEVVARMGGDEFTLLIPGIKEAEDALGTVQRVFRALKEPIFINGLEVHITTSIGIAVYPNDGEDAETLMKHADSAMYRAKEQGKNNYQFFAPVLSSDWVQWLTLENDLRKALERKEFKIYYQPQISIRTGRVIGLEALIRWHHPEKGLISPAQFIPLAEETGLIVPIGEWVLWEACRQNREWQDAGYAKMRIAVNTSARQFQQGNLAQTVQNVLRETGLDPRWLELELTESAAMHQAENVIDILQQIKKLGVSISIDDFGTGYSSLNYLKRFPVDFLKIDQTFVHDINQDSDDAVIVNAMIAVAHSLNLKVVAEGVETQEQLDFLKQRRCDVVQGYFFSKPVPGEEIESMLKSMKSKKGTHV